jgi:hypothetical protein
VRLKRQARDSAKRLYNRRSDGDVGDEMSVHHIHMNPIGSRPLGFCNLLTQASKVGRKNRRSEFDQIVLHVEISL